MYNRLMNKFQNLKKELDDKPIKKLLVCLMTIVIVLLSLAVLIMAEPTIKTVTSYDDCVAVDGYVSGRACIINGQEFTGPLRIHIPWSR